MATLKPTFLSFLNLFSFLHKSQKTSFLKVEEQFLLQLPEPQQTLTIHPDLSANLLKGIPSSLSLPQYVYFININY
jgi:hypothetical protein